MARRYILLTPADGPLWTLAEAVAKQTVIQRLNFNELAQLLCEREAKRKEVDIAQMSEVLSVLRDVLAENPAGVLEVLVDDN